jgi:hypothetical protein
VGDLQSLVCPTFNPTFQKGNSAVLKEAKENEVVFCETHEHPGGRDGGTFLQDNTYTVWDDNTAVVYTDYPDDPSCSVYDVPKEFYVPQASKDSATEFLKKELSAAKNAVVELEKLVAAFEGASDFCVVFGEEDEDED